MTPQFLRAEAARFREMAEAVTDREASRQRLLAMANDYEARATAADGGRSTEPSPEPDEPNPVPETEPPSDGTLTHSSPSDGTLTLKAPRRRAAFRSQ